MHVLSRGSYNAHHHGQPTFSASQHGGLPGLAGEPKAPIHSQHFNVQKLHRAPRVSSRSWTQGEIKKLVDLRSKGCTWTDISKELPGRTGLACRLQSQKQERIGNGQDTVARYDDRYLVQTQLKSIILNFSL